MFFREQLEFLHDSPAENKKEPEPVDKKLLRAKEKAEKKAKKAEEAELKIATQLYEKDMEIYQLECKKAEILKISPPPKPIGPKDVEQAEADLKENKA